MALVSRRDARSVGRTQEASIAKAIGATEDAATGRAARPGDTDSISPNPVVDPTIIARRIGYRSPRAEGFWTDGRRQGEGAPSEPLGLQCPCVSSSAIARTFRAPAAHGAGATPASPRRGAPSKPQRNGRHAPAPPTPTFYFECGRHRVILVSGSRAESQGERELGCGRSALLRRGACNTSVAATSSDAGRSPESGREDRKRPTSADACTAGRSNRASPRGAP
jgi:hypothetical protein